MALLSSAGGKYALTRQGIQTVVAEACEFVGYREPARKQAGSIEAMYGALMRHSEPLDKDALEAYFRPIDLPDPKKGRYGEYDFAGFWTDVASEQLPSLPGVEESGEAGFEFVGVDEDIAAPAQVRPLSDLREHPRTGVRNVLDVLVGPESAEYEDLLTLWDHVAQSGETTTERMEQAVRRVSVSSLADDLAELPHVERERVEPPTPEEIAIETYADVLEARDRVGSEPTAEWRYVE